MRSGLLDYVKYYVTLSFYLSLFMIPFFTYFTISDYFKGEESERIIESHVWYGSKTDSSLVKNNLADHGYHLDGVSGMIKFKSDSFFEHLVYSQFGVPMFKPFSNPIYCLFYSGLLLVLKSILDSVGEAKIFTRKNVKRIFALGWILIANSIYQMILSITLEFRLKSLLLPYSFVRGYYTNASDLHIGVLILCLGLIFKLGVQLKEEADLVV